MYLKKLYFHSKKIFFLAISFCIVQAFFIYKGVESFPFFNFGMYSERQESKLNYPGIIIKTDRKNFNYYSLPFLTKEMLVEPLNHYAVLKKNDFTDEPMTKTIEKRLKNHLSEKKYNYCLEHLTNSVKDSATFQQWFKNYLEFTSGKKIRKVEVYEGKYVYDSKSKPVLTDSLLLFKL